MRKAPGYSIVAALLWASASVAASGANRRSALPRKRPARSRKRRKKDDLKALLTVLGNDGRDIVSSGDEVADADTRQKFIAAYDAKNRIAMEGDNKAILVIGPEDFPLPIPLVRKDGQWRFDTAEGRNEILARRIGKNELDAIQASPRLCGRTARIRGEGSDRRRHEHLCAAHRQPAGQEGRPLLAGRAGRRREPAGRTDGAATRQGYRTAGGRTPYHGYYFKILTRQGPSAEGGALDYVVQGKMIGGFALVAYPAEYRNSGVMTLLVNHRGTVFQKDLGPQTRKLAEQMNVVQSRPSVDQGVEVLLRRAIGTQSQCGADKDSGYRTAAAGQSDEQPASPRAARRHPDAAL